MIPNIGISTHQHIGTKLPPIYLALIHHPVLNKEGKTVTTSVTNFDLHDLARTGRTYGVKEVFIVNPNPAQRAMVSFIWKYWHDGYGAVYNPDRRQAFAIITPATNVAEVKLTIKNRDGKDPCLIATSARKCEKALSFQELRRLRRETDRSLVLVLGTGHGLTTELSADCDAVLEPIHGVGDYNHLPVRAAAAIMLDRLVAQGIADSANGG